MSKAKEYIKLNLTDNGYDIYVITENNNIKLGRKNTSIMSKVLKKYPCKKINKHTYIYPNIIPIMLSFYKEKLKTKNKKVNRQKSRNIMTSIVLTASLTISGGLLASNFANQSDNTSNQKVTTESEFEFKETPIITNGINITDLVYTDTNNDTITTLEHEPEKAPKNSDTTNQNNTIYFSYKYEDIGDKEALENSEAYMDIFKKYEKIYGIDAKLLCAIGAQESSGIHRDYSVNGFATGLMGIENIWANASLTVFNFETNQYETITIDYSKIGELDYNIKIGAAIFQNYFNHTLKNNNNNIDESELLALAIQKYNMGPGNISKILKLGNNWMDNRQMINAGDQHYFEHVLSRLDNDTVINIRLTDGSYYTTNINNQSLNIQYSKL